jgi:hypothetical protein
MSNEPKWEIPTGITRVRRTDDKGNAILPEEIGYIVWTHKDYHYTVVWAEKGKVEIVSIYDVEMASPEIIVPEKPKKKDFF